MANCTVSGTLLNPGGVAISGAEVKFNIESPVLDASSNLLGPKEITTTTATDGSWSLDISQGVSGTLHIAIPPDSVTSPSSYEFSLVIPQTALATFASVWADANNLPSQTTFPLQFADIAGQLSTSQLPILTNGQLWIGNATNVATPVTPSGDATVSNAGVITISSSAVTNTKMANMADLKVKGNKSGGSAAPTDLALGSLTEAVSSVLTITGSSNLVGSGTIQVKQASASLSGYLSSGDWTTFNNKKNSGVEPISTGGTGQSTAVAAFDALAPTTTLGDLIYRGASNNVRLAGNTSATKMFLTQTGDGVNSAAPVYASIASADLPTITLTGNVTGAASAGSVATTIAAGVVANSMLATMSNNLIKGNVSGSTASPSDLTGTQVTAILSNVVGDSGSGGTKGLVPAPASGDAAALKFLKADGTWAALPATSAPATLNVTNFYMYG